MGRPIEDVFIDEWQIPYHRVCSSCRKDIRTHRKGFKKEWEQKLSLTMDCTAQECWEGYVCRDCRNGKTSKPSTDKIQPSLLDDDDGETSVSDVMEVTFQLREPMSRARKDAMHGKQLACMFRDSDKNDHKVILHLAEGRGIPVEITTQCIEIWDLTAKICLREAPDSDITMVNDPMYRKARMQEWDQIDRVYDVEHTNELLIFLGVNDG